MKQRILVIILSIGIAFLFMASGYGYWEKQLIIKAHIDVVDPPPPEPVAEITTEVAIDVTTGEAIEITTQQGIGVGELKSENEQEPADRDDEVTEDMNGTDQLVNPEVDDSSRKDERPADSKDQKSPASDNPAGEDNKEQDDKDKSKKAD